MRTRTIVILGFLVGAEAVMLLPDRFIVVAQQATPRAQTEVWACPMLCAKLHGPGECPVCGMALERVHDTGDRLTVSPSQARMIGLSTVKVERRRMQKEIHAVGTLDYTDARIRAMEVLAPDQARGRPISLRFDIYDSELPWISVGQPVDIVFDAWPGEVVPGVVENVGIGITRQTRATRVRVVVDSGARRLRTGMFARATIRANLGTDGRAEGVSLDGRYTCRSHSEVREHGPGECPRCGLPLWIDPKVDRGSSQHAPPVLALPRDAVLSTGRRHLAYRMAAPNTFEPRELLLGPRAGDYVMIRSGLEEGDVVARHGNFFIDSQMQLAGNVSLIGQ